MTFPIDKTEYEWEGLRMTDSDNTDSRVNLTTKRLREWAIALAREGNPLGMDLHMVAEAWDRDRREIDTLKQNWQRCVDHAAQAEEERNRLRDLVDTIRDGMSEALLKSATAGADGTGLYTDAAAAVAFGDIAVSWIEEQEALAATDSRVNPGEKRDD